MTLLAKLGALGAGAFLVAGSSAATVALMGGDHHDGQTGTPPAATPAVTNVANSSTDSARRVYDGAKQSVAYVSADTDQGQATGSGFVVSSDGKVVTNEHVVDGAQQVTVKVGTDGVERPAQVLAADASKDLALLQVEPGGASLKPLTFGDSSRLQVGDTTYAIGNPFGLDHTFTRGIVSALGREIQAPDGTAIDGAIQTDAAINPGNSGGALLDDQGRVIGVNAQIAGGGGGGNVGIGFAIPSSTVADFVAHPTTQTAEPDPYAIA